LSATKNAAVRWIGGLNQPKGIFAMQKSMRLLLCASTAALILGAAPIGAFIAPAQAQVDVSISATIAPPLLPVYAQPAIPGPGYLWIPGYWAWDGQEYFWTPGYWSMPPTVGFYWTPPYWGWLNGAYVFNAGYWGPTVGFYGGINYGFGYNGVGYQGGMWQGNTFVYNRTVNNFGNVNIANSYSRPVSNPASHVAFNGGNGGTTARPTQAQIAARASGAPPTAAQMQHQAAASKDPTLGFNANHGKPPITAMQRPNEFHGAAAATNAAAEHPQAATPERPQAATPAQPAPAGRSACCASASAYRRSCASGAPACRLSPAGYASARRLSSAGGAPACRVSPPGRAPERRLSSAGHAPERRFSRADPYARHARRGAPACERPTRETDAVGAGKRQGRSVSGRFAPRSFNSHSGRLARSRARRAPPRRRRDPRANTTRVHLARAPASAGASFSRVPLGQSRL
jgi:hypothetical protein